MKLRSLTYADALIGLPVLAMLGLGAAAFLGLEARPVRSVVVYGGPSLANRTFHFRLEAKTELYHSRTPLTEERLVVKWQGPTSSTERALLTGPDGWADGELDPPWGARHLDLTVYEADGETALVSGRVELPIDRYLSAKRRGGRLQGVGASHERFELMVESGALAAPFPAKIRGRIAELGGEASRLLAVSLSGGELLSPSEIVVKPGEEFVLRLRPRAHQVELSLRLHGTEFEFTGLLPVIPGALFAEVEGDRLRVFDPLGREHAYLNYFSKEGRGKGMRVALDPSTDGTSSASLPFEPRRSPSDAPRFALVSPEPDGRTAGTLGYPLDEPSATWDVVDGRLLDGGALGESRERRRRERVKGWILGYGVSLFALFLLVLVRKRAFDQERLDRFADAGLEAEQVVAKSSDSVVPFVLVVATIFLLSLGWALLSPTPG